MLFFNLHELNWPWTSHQKKSLNKIFSDFKHRQQRPQRIVFEINISKVLCHYELSFYIFYHTYIYIYTYTYVYIYLNLIIYHYKNTITCNLYNYALYYTL